MKIYCPNAHIFSWDLPEFKDPLSVQQILSPSLQWQMLIYFNEVSKHMSQAELLDVDCSMGSINTRLQNRTEKPAALESLEYNYRGKRNWKLFCRDYMNESVVHIFFKNYPTRLVCTFFKIYIKFVEKMPHW